MIMTRAVSMVMELESFMNPGEQILSRRANAEDKQANGMKYLEKAPHDRICGPRNIKNAAQKTARRTSKKVKSEKIYIFRIKCAKQKSFPQDT